MSASYEDLDSAYEGVLSTVATVADERQWTDDEWQTAQAWIDAEYDALSGAVDGFLWTFSDAWEGFALGWSAGRAIDFLSALGGYDWSQFAGGDKLLTYFGAAEAAAESEQERDVAESIATQVGEGAAATVVDVGTVLEPLSPDSDRTLWGWRGAVLAIAAGALLVLGMRR